MTRDEAKTYVAYWMPSRTPLNVARSDIQNVVINKIYDSFEKEKQELIDKYSELSNKYSDLADKYTELKLKGKE